MNKYLKFFKTIEIDKKGWILILIGTVSWSLTMIKSGFVYSYGMGFWGPNGHDGIWHIAIAQGLAKGSWQMPIFAGETIKNYHIGFDLILAVLHKLTFIPIHTLYFQIIPPILAFFIGLLAYQFTLSWTKSRRRAFWATFFVYFGGSFGWIVTLLRSGKIGGESLFWSQQSVSTLINPPFALSILLIFLGLNLLVREFHSRRVSKHTPGVTKLLLATFLFGILVQVKVYAGLLCLGGLFTAGIWQIMKRRGIFMMKVFVGSLVLSILLFSPLTKDVGQTIIFKPFWFLESMLATPDRLYWPKMASAMANYKLANNLIKGIPAYLVAFIIFWYGNFGTRFLFEIYTAKKLVDYKKLSWIEAFIFPVIFAGILIPTFFVQSGNSWNTIQFMYYSLVFSGILAGVFLGGWIGNQLKNISKPTSMRHILIYVSRIYIPVGLMVLLTIPTTIGTLWYHYLPSRPPAKISNEELEALEFLSDQPDGIVLTLPFDKSAADAAINDPPRPLYLYESTAYVSAFSGKPVYLEDEVNLEITGYEWKDRREDLMEFLQTSDIGQTSSFLKENKIRYVYWVKDFEMKFGEQNLFEVAYENKEIDILRVTSW